MRKTKTKPSSPIIKSTKKRTNQNILSPERTIKRSTGFKSDFDKSAQLSSSSSQATRLTRKRPIPITPSKDLDSTSTSIQSKRIKLSSNHHHHIEKSKDSKENRERLEEPTSDDELALKKPITRSNSKILTKSNFNHQSKSHSNLIKSPPIQNKGKQISNHQSGGQSSNSPSSTNLISQKLTQLFHKHHLDLSKLQNLIKSNPQSLISIIKSGLDHRFELNGNHIRINQEGELLDELDLLSPSINSNNNTIDKSHRTRRSANKESNSLEKLDETSQSFLDEIKALIQLEFVEFDLNHRSNKKPSNSKSRNQTDELDDAFVLNDCLLSEVDARCLSVADESMSGGFEPDPDEEEEEKDDDDAVIAELAINTPIPPNSSNRNLPINLSQDSPDSSPTRQSSRIKKITGLQSKHFTPIPSPTRSVPIVKDSKTSKPISTLSQSRPISSFKPIVTVPSIRTATPRLTSPLPTTPPRTRTRVAVAIPNTTITSELPKTAATSVTNKVTTTTTKSPTRNSKSKKKVYSKEIVLPLLHSLLPHLSGTSPLPIQFPITDRNDEIIDKKKMLNEIECLVGLEETELELRMVLNRTIVEHEGNVLLLCGGRGSGKTTIINRTLGLFQDPKIHGPNSFITIRLNGLIQTNDKLALREMSRQLIIALNTDKIGLPEEEEELIIIEDGTRFNTYAKTLKNLIHLLEPTLENEENEENEISKTLIIILEEFDKFTQLDRQAFLYTLLDIVQGNRRRGGICVIGTTAVVDCLDRLEKRVKSRCQSRIQYLFSPKTYIERKELIKSILSFKKDQKNENENENENEEIESFKNQWNHELEVCLGLDCVKVWLENLFGLISDGIPKILQELNKLISMISYKLKTKGTIEFPILSKSFPFKPLPSLSLRTIKSKHWWNDSTNLLSSIELTILISSKHLSNLYENRMFNLEMCWDSYRKHLKRLVRNEDGIEQSLVGIENDEFGNNGNIVKSKSKGSNLNFGFGIGRSQVYGRDSFEMGWERLINLEILLPIKHQIEFKSNHEINNNGLIGNRFEYVRLVLFLSEIDELVENRIDLALHLKKWCKNWSD